MAIVKPLLAAVALCLIIFASYHFLGVARFEKSRWTYAGDISDYPHRNSIVKDLVDNHLVVGMSYKQIEAKLGRPDLNQTHELTYFILTEYGADIDPVYVKSLILELNNDRSLKNFRVFEWQK